MRARTFHGIEESPEGRVGGRSPSDVAVLGAPFDSGAGSRAGARYGPDAVRTAPYLGGEVYHIAFGTRVFQKLAVVDVGDAEVAPVSHTGSLDNLRKRAREVVGNTGCLVTLGGDQSIVLPVLEAEAERHGPVALVHFDPRGDIADPGDGPPRDGTVIRRAVEQGLVRHGHQIGMRGYGPVDAEPAWAVDNGLLPWPMSVVDERGMAAVVEEVLGSVSGPVHLSVDIGVLDPAFAPGTGAPEPGGLTSRELLTALRVLTRNLDVVGVDVTEVCPPYDNAETTAIAANRCVMEVLAAKAARKG
ncbi:arginase family protein [Spirillospora sp. NPDC050679]